MVPGIKHLRPELSGKTLTNAGVFHDGQVPIVDSWELDAIPSSIAFHVNAICTTGEGRASRSYKRTGCHPILISPIGRHRISDPVGQEVLKAPRFVQSNPNTGVPNCPIENVVMPLTCHPLISLSGNPAVPDRKCLPLPTGSS